MALKLLKKAKRVVKGAVKGFVRGGPVGAAVGGARAALAPSKAKSKKSVTRTASTAVTPFVGGTGVSMPGANILSMAAQLLGPGTGMPAKGPSTNTALLPAVAQPVFETTPARAPKGYVTITVSQQLHAQWLGVALGSKLWMRKDVARALKLWKAPARPPISASDWKALKTAHRTSKKIRKIASVAGFATREKGRPLPQASAKRKR